MVEWCLQSGINPSLATSLNVKSYRLQLVTAGYKPASIAHKLTIIRWFYAAAVDNGLRPDHPASGEVCSMVIGHCTMRDMVLSNFRSI
jgi:site-specific recombinase XerD